MEMKSVHPPHTIKVEGFELQQPERDMATFLGLSKDIAEAVAKAFEEEIYRQTRDAQVKSITLDQRPLIESKMIRESQSSTATLNRVRFGFPLKSVIHLNGGEWEMRAMLTYERSGMAQASEPTPLIVHFNVIEAVALN